MSTFVVLVLGAYGIGSVPTSYLAAKLAGIDPRRHGTGYVGASNLWRLTSWRIGLPVVILDITKGALIVLMAYWAGLGTVQQVTIGTVAIAGHNWSLFLRFKGGRGNATTLGVALILPVINNLVPWGAIISSTIVFLTMVLIHDTPPGVFVALAILPMISWLFAEPPAMTLGFSAMFILAMIARVTAPRTQLSNSVSPRQLLLNRLLFDRDIRDKKAWMNRLSSDASTAE